jgi:hypothetical protein
MYATGAEVVGHTAQLPPSAFSTRSLPLCRLRQASMLNDWMREVVSNLLSTGHGPVFYFLKFAVAVPNS